MLDKEGDRGARRRLAPCFLAMVALASLLSIPSVAIAQSSRPVYLAIDTAALSNPDAGVRNREISRVVNAADQFAPLVFAPVAAALFHAGRREEARTWYFRGKVRTLVDVTFQQTEFNVGGLRDIVVIYDMEVSSDQDFAQFIGDGTGDANTRAIDEAFSWDATTPRGYPIDWAVGHSIDSYVAETQGRHLDVTLRPGWEERLAEARQSTQSSISAGRQAMAQAQAAEEARAAAARAGSVAPDAAAVSSDPLDPAFGGIAEPQRTLDLNGCVGLGGQPLDSGGQYLFVRCPDFEKIDLRTSAVVRRWPVAELEAAGACSRFDADWPMTEAINWPPRGDRYVANADADLVLASCSDIGAAASGPASLIRLPILIARRGARFEILTVDASHVSFDFANLQFLPELQLSRDGQFLLLTASSQRESLGILVDLERRAVVRVFRPTDAPHSGLSGPYSGFHGVLLDDPPAVLAQTWRPGPSERPQSLQPSVLLWRLDTTAVAGIDFNGVVNVHTEGLPSPLWTHRGPISLRTQERACLQSRRLRTHLPAFASSR